MIDAGGTICARSIIYGRGIYRWDGDFYVDPYDPMRAESPVLENVLTGERFFMRILNQDCQIVDALVNRIMRPPTADLLLWPRDLVTVSPELSMQCNAYAYREYSDGVSSRGERGGDKALLFDLDHGLSIESLRCNLDRLDEGTRNWRNPKVRSLIWNIANAIDELNSNGYAYFDFSLDRILLSNGVLRLDFSPLCVGLDEYRMSFSDRSCIAQAGLYPVEFAEPALMGKLGKGATGDLDLRSQNYSLAALFMYLMVGRYAYDGPLLAQYPDEDPMEHYIKFREYHKMPVFIFDSEETENALGFLAEDEEVIELWNAIPQVIREMLEATLTRRNALRENDSMNPTAGLWLQNLRSLGWVA